MSATAAGVKVRGTTGRRAPAPAAIVLMLLSLAGCDRESPAVDLSACAAAVKSAADIPANADSVTDLDEAIRVCPTLAELVAAADRFPDALDGVSAETFVANRCLYEPSLASSAICQALD